MKKQNLILIVFLVGILCISFISAADNCGKSKFSKWYCSIKAKLVKIEPKPEKEINCLKLNYSDIKNLPEVCCSKVCKAGLLASEVSNDKFILYKNDCTHHSTRLVKRLKEIGIQSTCVQGLHNGKSAHIWVRATIDGKKYNIEATPCQTFKMNDICFTGVLDDETYNKYYKNAKEVMCFTN